MRAAHALPAEGGALHAASGTGGSCNVLNESMGSPSVTRSFADLIDAPADAVAFVEH